MLRVLFFFLGWLVFVVAMSLLIYSGQSDDASSDTTVAEIIEHLDIDVAFQAEILQQINQSYQDSNFLAALALLDEHEPGFNAISSSHPELTYLFYFIKGHVHTHLWQYVEADKSWRTALDYSPDRVREKKLNDLLNTSRLLLDDINHERELSTTYHASPNIGPAAKLQGKIAVVYVFLTDGALQRWSLRKRDFVMNNWSFVENWLHTSSSEYDSNLSFSQRIFLVDKNPYIKRLRVGDFDNNYQHADRVAHLVAANFGHKNMREFVEQIKHEESADEVILLLHLARQGRSFASRCMHRCENDGEFVYIMENANTKSWESLGYVQAHETLHLFGADDLYNIRDAGDYAVRDIMNYPSSFLQASTIEPITAYAIGLFKDRPLTPFQIKNYSPSGYNKR